MPRIGMALGLDPEPVIALPGPGLIVPIGPHPAARIVQLKRVGPAIGEQPRKRVA